MYRSIQNGRRMERPSSDLRQPIRMATQNVARTAIAGVHSSRVEATSMRCTFAERIMIADDDVAILSNGNIQ